MKNLIILLISAIVFGVTPVSAVPFGFTEVSSDDNPTPAFFRSFTGKVIDVHIDMTFLTALNNRPEVSTRGIAPFKHSPHDLLENDVFRKRMPWMAEGPFRKKMNEKKTGRFFDRPARPAPVAPVPEPATMLLLGAGLFGIAGFSRNKSNKSKIGAEASHARNPQTHAPDGQH